MEELGAEEVDQAQDDRAQHNQRNEFCKQPDMVPGHTRTVDSLARTGCWRFGQDRRYTLGPHVLALSSTTQPEQRRGDLKRTVGTQQEVRLAGCLAVASSRQPFAAAWLWLLVSFRLFL